MNVQKIRIDHIKPFKKNPCNVIDDGFITELAASIREIGLTVPILVTPVDDENYELIDGKKRWTACQRLGFEEIDAIVKEVADEKEQFILGLVTNLQRQTLTPMEIAQSIDFLLKLEVSQRDIAKMIGKSQAWVQVRHVLLKLEPETLKLAGPETPSEQRLSQAQAYLLIDIPKENQVEVAKIISERQLSVADTRRFLADFVRGQEVTLKNNNTSRLMLIEDINKFNKFMERTNEYLDNFLAIEAKKFTQLFDGQPLDKLDNLQDMTEEATQSMVALAEVLRKVKAEKLSSDTGVELKKKDEINESDSCIETVEVNKIDLRTASTIGLLNYLGLGRWDLYPKGKSGKKKLTFWNRPIDHQLLLEKAKKKYRERIKTAHPDIADSTNGENAGVLNRVWDMIQQRFQLHGFSLNDA